MAINPKPTREIATMRVTLSTPDGPIRGQVEVDTGPMRLADLVPTALELTDMLVARASRKEAQAGRTISCRAGCGACCRQMVGLSAPECFYLADFVETMPVAARAAAQKRFVEIEIRLQNEGLLAPLMDPECDDERSLGIALKYFFLGVPCPFLIEESCSIHEDRPVVCREYNVTSAAELCRDPIHNPIMRVPMPQPLSTPLARLAAEMAGIETRLVPLSLAPRWVAEHEPLRHQTWPGLDLFNRFLQLVSEVPSK